MRWNASFLVFRCGVSIPSAVLITCLFANNALSQTPLEVAETRPDEVSASVDNVSEIPVIPLQEPTPPTSFKVSSFTIEQKCQGSDIGCQPSGKPNFQLFSSQTGISKTEILNEIANENSEERSSTAAMAATGDAPAANTPPQQPRFLSDFSELSSPASGNAKDLEPLPLNSQLGFSRENWSDINPILLDFLAQNVNPPQQVAPPVNPQPNPNDRFLQPVPPTPETPEQRTPPPIQEQPTPETTPPPASPPIPVTKIEVVGSTILSPEEIRALVSPLEGRSATLEELRKVADKITEIYLDRGYITSRAVVPEQTITNGLVRIQVTEGVLAKIEVEGNKRLNTSYITSRILLGAAPPLSTAALEDQLRLLRADPLLENVEASLRAGDKEGESSLIVRVTEADPFEVSFSIDNYSPPSIGSERLGLSVRHRNLTGAGDLISLSYYPARLGKGDSDVLDFVYNRPINAMNGAIQFRVAPNRNSIIQAPFDVFDIEGKSQLYEISYRQPLVRTPIEEFALSFGFTYQQSQTFLAGEGTRFGTGPGEDGISRSSVFKFGQDYIRRDPQGAWALRSQFSLGTGLFNATTNNDPNPDGRFLSWLGQVQRVQRLGNDHLLIVQGDLQLTPNSLLPSQQFVIGGGLSLRGYRQNVRSGDNGFRVSVEDRITIDRDASGIPLLQFAPFVDLGMVWNHSDNPNQLPSQRFLAGVGLGFIWQPLPQVNVRLDYGYPLIDLDDKGNNAQDKGFYFSVIYSPW